MGFTWMLTAWVVNVMRYLAIFQPVVKAAPMKNFMLGAGYDFYPVVAHMRLFGQQLKPCCKCQSAIIA